MILKCTLEINSSVVEVVFHLYYTIFLIQWEKTRACITVSEKEVENDF